MIGRVRPAFFSLFLIVAGCGGGEASSDGSAAAAQSSPNDVGRRVFSGTCAVCHSVKDPTAPGYTQLVGPSLFGVVGAKAGHVADFDYSKAMRESGLTWDDATLNTFLENPQRTVPRTRMAFAGEPDPARREAIISYLKTLK